MFEDFISKERVALCLQGDDGGNATYKETKGIYIYNLLSYKCIYTCIIIDLWLVSKYLKVVSVKNDGSFLRVHSWTVCSSTSETLPQHFWTRWFQEGFKFSSSTLNLIYLVWQRSPPTCCCNPQTEALDLSVLEKVWELICQTAEQQPAIL